MSAFLVNLFRQTGIGYKTLNGDITTLGLELFVNVGRKSIWLWLNLPKIEKKECSAL